ncbi:general secretion pathway protein F [Chitinivorax tropicus]|uniref:General secretion pathway protein F n=1 Tax=Chitinivorax tropicus TaxID=714531 RepID=A0A840MYW0_9PROT|nr:type II secretion system F family protein [Chitinivorax tropicus]MBB5020341.1 general secretion pathway protein F [Chitinivorax tropicus]
MSQRFEISALDAQRRLVRLSIDATSMEDARRGVESRGLKLLSIESKAQGGGFALSRAPKFDLLLFCRELTALLVAGLPVTEAIETLSEKEHRPAIKSILDGVKNSLFQGQTLSQCMSARPDIFPELFVATVRASEHTGELHKSIIRYINYQEQVETLRKRLVSAAIYPAILLVVGGGVCLFLLGYLVPKFSRIYEGLNTDLPTLSKWLLAFGGWLDKNQTSAGIGVVMFIAALVLVAKQPAVRAAVVARAWRSPWLGERLRIFQLARFYRAAGMLLRGGIPLVTSFERVADLLSPALRQPLLKVIAALKQGQPLADTMQREGLTTPVALRLLRVGEKSGQLGDMMEHVATFYDDELARWVDVATKLFEPILMLFMGGFIGLVVLLMYLPIFDLAGGVK